jgi:hypothetical protein
VDYHSQFALAISSDNKILLSNGESSAIFPQNACIKKCRWAPRNDIGMLGLITDNIYRTLNIEPLQGIGSFKIPKDNLLRAVEWSLDGNNVFLGADFGLWKSSVELHIFPLIYESVSPIVSICNADRFENSILLGLRNGSILLFDMKSKRSKCALSSMRKCIDHLWVSDNCWSCLAQDVTGSLNMLDLRMPSRVQCYIYKSLENSIVRNRGFWVSSDENFLVIEHRHNCGVAVYDLNQPTLPPIREILVSENDNINTNWIKFAINGKSQSAKLNENTQNIWNGLFVQLADINYNNNQTIFRGDFIT